ncbi:MAG: hemolysin III family protein [Bdellovibrionales bacterium]|nr:hemolysin III family protein [Bdellovibrionales bacterium]
MISRWPIFVFLLTAVLCLLFSTIFHLFNPLSSSNHPFT